MVFVCWKQNPALLNVYDMVLAGEARQEGEDGENVQMGFLRLYTA